MPGDAERLPPVRVSLIAHGSRERPWVALTFDLCQDPKYPSGFDRKIYKALVDAQAPATFFFGGDWARTHVDQARLLLANPLFEAGNHSWSHPDFTTLDEGEIRSQVIMTQNILHRLSGRQPTLFRLPAGKYNDLALETIASLGLYTIQWDADSGDPDPTITADEMVALIKTRVQNGSIILMHANGRGWNTAAALPGMIAYLRGAGYKLVTVSELLAAP